MMLFLHLRQCLLRLQSWLCIEKNHMGLQAFPQNSPDICADCPFVALICRLLSLVSNILWRYIIFSGIHAGRTQTVQAMCVTRSKVKCKG